MSLQTIEDFIASLPNVTVTENFGYRFFLYASEQTFPFATLIENDTEYDNISNLNREGVFRLNIGIGRESFKALFPEENKQWDYTELNRFMPHPDYAAQNYICVLSPTGDVLEQTLQYIREAYELAKGRFEKKQK